MRLLLVSVTVTDASGNSASCSISLSTISLSGSGVVGSTMSVSGSGFGAGAKLSLNVDGGGSLSLGGTTAADASGSFSGLTFVVPALSAGLHCVWVSSSGGSATASLWVISGYSVTFAESGLPSGTSWSVTLGGKTQSSTTSTIVFTGVPVGTVSYSAPTASVNSNEQYAPTSDSGSLTVSGDTSQSLTYTHQVLVSFSATGLDGDASGNVVLHVSGPAGEDEQTYYWWNLPSNLWVNSGSTYFFWTGTVYVNSGEQFIIQSASGSSPITSPGTYTALYQKQFLVTFTTNGLDSDAGNNIALTIGSNSYAWDNLPSNLWVNSGSYFWANPLTANGNEKFVLTAGSASGSVAAGTFSVTYQKQVQVTFSATGLNADTGGNVVLRISGPAGSDEQTYYWWNLPVTFGLIVAQPSSLGQARSM